MTILAPLKTLEAYAQTVEEVDYWASDGTPYAGFPYVWRLGLTVTPQYHSDPNLSMAYDGLSIVVGDWFSNLLGGIAWRIKTIESNDGATVTCIVEDVDQYNTYADPSQAGSGAPQPYINGFIFSLDTLNQPIVTPAPDQIHPQWQSDLISRFWYTFPASSGTGGGGAYLPLAGGTMQGQLILDADPINNLGAATKQYTDQIYIDGGSF